MNIKSLPEILTISQVAEILGVSTGTLRRWDKEGKLISFRPGKTSRRRYKKEDVLSLISQNREVFLTPKQQSELITALKGRHEIPLKFVYVDEGSNNWDTMVEDRNYAIGDLEKELIRDNIDKIYKEMGRKKYNIVDIGPGNGKKTIPIINKFLGSYNQIYYNALDISSAMIELALKNIKRVVKKKIEISQNIIDFEEGNFSDLTRFYRKQQYPNNLLLLLGNTVGNPFDKDRVLTNIRESMVLTDYLLIGMEIADFENPQKIINHYRQPIVLKFCFFCLEKLGFNINDGEIKVKFNKRKSQIEMRFVYNKESSIIYNDELIKFKKGDSALLLISYKSTRDSLEKLLERTGFKINLSMTNKDQSYSLVLCQPVSY